MSQANSAEKIHDDLAALRDQIRSTRVLAGFLLFLALVAGAIFAFSLLAGANILPILRAEWARWAALILLALSAAAALFYLVVRPLAWRPTYDALARIAEERIPELDNSYINGVQLARERRTESPLLLFRAIDECYARAKRFDLGSAVDRGGFRRRAWIASIVGVCLLAYMLAAPAKFAAGFSMLVNPAKFVPSVGDASIAYVKPGDLSVVRGQEVTIEAAIAKALKAIPTGSMHVVLAGGERADKELLAVSPTEFRASLGPAQLPYGYMVEIGGTESAWYHVAVSERPSVKAINIRYEYPAYTGKTHEVMANAAGDVSGPYGTVVTLEVEGTRPLASAYMQFDEGRLELVPTTGDYKRGASFTLRKDGMYRIALTDTSGNAGDASVPHAVKVILDQPPVVTMPLPGKDVSVPAGGSVAVAVEGSDDYGIDAVELVIADADLPDAERVVGRWEHVDVKGATLSYTITVDPAVYGAGKSYVLYARAKDNNSLTGPGEGRSQKYVLRVVDPAAAQAELVKSIESWVERLKKVLAAQEAARAEVRAAEAAPDAAGETVTRVRGQQEAIRGEATSVAADMTIGGAAVEGVRRLVEGLVAGDMTSAVDLCDTLGKKSALSSADLAPLGQTQDRIVERLRRILDITAVLLEDAKAGKLAEGNEIPADVQEQLRKLLEELKKFTEEQKRVIEASNNLAAMPVDDYTDADKAKLKELQAAEDNWSKFLKEAYSDLSKLPKQDFTNPSVLQDLVQTYSEVEMAADALAKEPVTMAVPHEQSGLKLAEELTTHIEKWLPDTPDRIKWEMEEPLTDVNVPMAELPTSLQDIVGDLMEQEEDLFDDVEDVSSSWADSLDKGAGWDALDGPISNMSAQGVTGNTLPNSSEISGRSGEGRTGKASGEFVGDSSVGKGGRRTPTRITPEPFMAGDVKDTSKEGPGGATGGGKQSGAGELGLQGPVPRELSQAIARLQGKQSQIISKAQKLNVALKLAGYPNGDMTAAIDAMKETEAAISKGQLNNAIRRRPVLVKSLKGVGSVVSNDLVVNKDNSLVLPRGMQEEIMDGAQGRAPRGYDKLLKGYYESLSSPK